MRRSRRFFSLEWRKCVRIARSMNQPFEDGTPTPLRFTPGQVYTMRKGNKRWGNDWDD